MLDLVENLHRVDNVQSVIRSVLERSLAICHCDFGNVQLMNWQAGHLEIKAQRGFHLEFF
jgi:hypothetical protein